MLFSITNNAKQITTHCGVLEFSAEEGRVYMPFWMQQHLQLKPGEIVSVKSAVVEKGDYVKLRPQQKAFIEISDPKAVLENKLRHFSCLTKGDTIMINYNNTQYLIDVLEVKSIKGNTNVISIVETDVKVDFERPLDMPESPLPEQQVDFPIITKKKEEEKKEEKQGFRPFIGTGRRIDGKPIKQIEPVVKEQPKQQTTTTTKKSSFVFGSSKKEPKTPVSTKTENEKPKWTAFSGRGRTLK